MLSFNEWKMINIYEMAKKYIFIFFKVINKIEKTNNGINKSKLISKNRRIALFLFGNFMFDLINKVLSKIKDKQGVKIKEDIIVIIIKRKSLRIEILLANSLQIDKTLSTESFITDKCSNKYKNKQKTINNTYFLMIDSKIEIFDTSLFMD